MNSPGNNKPLKSIFSIFVGHQLPAVERVAVVAVHRIRLCGAQSGDNIDSG